MAEALTITVPEGGVEFRREGGELLASLVPMKSGGAAFVLGAEGEAQVVLVARAGCAQALLSSGKDGQISEVKLTADTGGVVEVSDTTGGRGGRLMGDAEGGLLTLQGANGKTAIQTGSNAQGGFLTVAGPEAGPVACLRSVPDGGLLSLDTAGQHPAVSLGASGGDGALIVWDKSGGKTFAVPVWKFTEAHSPDQNPPADENPPG